MGRQRSLSKIPTADPTLDRIQDHVIQTLTPILQNPGVNMANWQLNEGPYPTSTSPISLLVQKRSGTDTWTTLAAVDGSGNLSTAIPKSLLASIGDLIYASAASTPARLAIGNAGDVLTVVSGVPAWRGWVKASYFLSTNPSINNGAFTRVNFDTKVYDSDNAVTVGAGWVFTCPTGRGGVYKISSAVNLASAAAPGNWIVDVYKNGTEFMRLFQMTPASSGAGNFQAGGSADVSLTAGDTLAINVFQSSGVAQPLLGGQAFSWVTILGPF